jgi:hypothetical protein
MAHDCARPLPPTAPCERQPCLASTAAT